MSLFGKESDLTSLVRRCQRQDSEAWAQLVDRFSAYVYSIARRHRLNDEDAADVFQNTFLALHRGIDRLEEPETLPKWLAVTASRMSLRAKRVQKKTVSLEAEEGSLEDLIASEEATAEQEAASASQALSLRRAVASMKDRCGPLLQMLYFDEDATYQSVSDQLGVPVGAIGPTRARCLEKLRKILLKAGFFE